MDKKNSKFSDIIKKAPVVQLERLDKNKKINKIKCPLPPLSPIVPKEGNKNHDPLETPIKSSKSNDSFNYEDKENPTFLQNSTNRIESTRIEEAITSTPNPYSNNPLSSKSRMNRPNLDEYDFGSSIRKTNKPNARQSGFDSSSTPKIAFKEIQNNEKSGLAQVKPKKELNKIESNSSNEGMSSQAEQLNDADDDDVEYSIVDKNGLNLDVNNNNEDQVIKKILSEHSYHLPDTKEKKQPKKILKAINESDQEEERIEKPKKRVRIISLSSDSETNDDESKTSQKPEIPISKKSRKIESDEEEEKEEETVTENAEQTPLEIPVLFDDRDDLESYSSNNQKKERKKSSNTSENDQSKNTSQKSESSKAKPKDKVKKESAKRTSSNVESSNNATEENDDDAGLRRSKRHRIGRDSIAIYEFKPMKDDKGNQVMVQELVGTKPKTNFYFGSFDLGSSERSDRKTEAKLTANEFRKYKKEIKPEDKHTKNDEKKGNIQEIEAQSEQSNETNAEVANFVNNEQTKTKSGVEKDDENEKEEDSVNLDEISIAEITPSQENVTVKDCTNETQNNQQIYCFSKYLNDKEYEVVDSGSEIFAATNQNCVIRINEGATTRTIMHDTGLTLFVQKGNCLLWLNGVLTEHKETDVIIIPKCLKYKIKNLSKESKLYIFFQFY